MPFHAASFGFILHVSRNSSHPLHEAFVNGGMLWFPNLTATDPTGIMPVMSAFMGMANMRLSLHDTGDNKKAGFKKYLPGLPLLGIPINRTFPVAFNFYFFIVQAV